MKVKIALLVLIFLAPITQSIGATNLPVDKVKWYWSDTKTSDTNRTFSEVDYANQFFLPSIRIEAYDPIFQLASVSFERFKSGKWIKYGINHSLGIALRQTDNTWLLSTDLAMEPCGVYLWCNETSKFRFSIGNEIISEVSVTFLPKTTELKLKLKSVSEIAWGNYLKINVAVSPAKTSKCSLTRGSSIISRSTFPKGSGIFSVRALTYEKPVDGVTQVNFLVTCTQGSKLGRAEKTVTVFVP